MSDIDVTITCPDCGAPMVERINSHNLSSFLGCSNYPDCKHTDKLPEYVAMRRAGADQLPGFD